MAISSTLHIREGNLPETNHNGAYNLVKYFHLNKIVTENLFIYLYKYGADRHGYDVQNMFCSFIVEHI